MDQEIRFCTTSDGVQLAYSLVGAGPPLVKAPNWLTHLEFEWSSPVWSHWWEELAKDHTLVRFDQRGSGLSERDVTEQSFDTWVSDLGAVVDHVGLEKFALLGISQGGAVATAYVSRNSGRVSRLVLYGAYGRGNAKSGGGRKDEIEAWRTLTRAGWGRNDPTYRQMFTSRFMPDATLEQMRWFNDLQRVSTSGENAANVMEVIGNIDVLQHLGDVDVPTLVLHARGDSQVPFEQGRQLASMIPNSRFVPLEGTNHLILSTEPSWSKVVNEVRAFLLADPDQVVSQANEMVVAENPRLPVGLTVREGEVLKLVASGMSNADISRELFITINTVANHVKNILSKTDSANRTEAAAFAVTNNLT